LKNIGEIAVKGKSQPRIHRVQAVVAEAQSFVAGALPQEFGAIYVQQPARKLCIPVRDVRIGEIDSQQDIVLADRRTEKHWSLILDLQHKFGEKTRPRVINPLLAQTHGLDIAVSIENRKGITVFQYSRPIVRERRLCENVVLIANFDDLHWDPRPLSVPPTPAGGANSRRF